MDNLNGLSLMGFDNTSGGRVEENFYLFEHLKTKLSSGKLYLLLVTYAYG